MEQNLLIDSDFSDVDEDYESESIHTKVDNNNESNMDDDEEAEEDWYEWLDALWNPDKKFEGHDYIAYFGREAWDKVYQARMTRHRNIVFREFARRLPNLSEQEKNGLFDAFSSSDAFGVIEHNALLEALADPIEGWNLYEWDKYYYNYRD